MKLITKDWTKIILFLIGALFFLIGAILMALFHFLPDLKDDQSLNIVRQFAYIINSGGLYSAFLAFLRNGKKTEKNQQNQMLLELRILNKKVKKLEKKHKGD